MKLSELKQKIDEALASDPSLVDAEVLVDTEARRYNAHLIEATGFWVLEKEVNPYANRPIVYLTLDDYGTDL